MTEMFVIWIGNLMWLWNTWHVATGAEELTIKFYLILMALILNSHVTNGYHIGLHGSRVKDG